LQMRSMASITFPQYSLRKSSSKGVFSSSMDFSACEAN
jgi:hypothetical protein